MATLLIAKATANMAGIYQAIGMVLGNMIDQKLFGPEYKQYGSRMDDLQLQTSTLGADISKVYGENVRVSGNIIWGTNFIEHVSTTKSGGKGGGGGTTTTTDYSYSISFAVALCEGPILGINRVWADGKLLDMARYEYTVYNGDEAQLPDEFIEGLEGEGNVPAYRGLAYVVFKDFYVDDFGRRIPNLTFEVLPAIKNLDAIIENISQDAGIPSTDIDVTDLAGIVVPGYEINGDKTFRNRIEQLALVYLFDAGERNGKIVYRIRNMERLTNSEIISVNDLGAYENEPPEKTYTVTRMHDLELPRQLTVNYISKEKDYQAGAMPAKRRVVESRSEVSVDLSIVMTDAEAKTLAEKRLYETWLNRTSYETPVPQRYGFIFPGDIVQLPIGGSTRYCLLSKTTFGRPGIMEIQGVDIGGTIYRDLVRTVDGEISPGLGAAPTVVLAEFLDIPDLPWDTQTYDERIYIAACADVFWGANLFRTDDEGTTYRFVVNIPRQATMGKAATQLLPGLIGEWDLVNTLDVVLYHGTLESRPENDVLNGGFNAALLGNEIFQFTTATLIAENTYRLSGLMRGRLGTESEMDDHFINERFVLLDSNITAVPLPSVDKGVERQYRIGPATLPVTDEKYADISFVYRGSTEAAPPNLDYFSVSVLGSDMVFSFRRNSTDGVIKGYDIRKGALFEASQLVCRVAGKETDQASIPAVIGIGQKYWIAAFNDSGYCTNPLYDVIDIESLPEREIVLSQTNYLTPASDITGEGVVTSSAIAQKGGPRYSELIAKTYNELLVTNMFGPAQGLVTITGDIIDLGKICKVILSVDERWIVSPDQPSIIEVSTSADGSNWTEWKLLTAGIINAQYFQIRLTICGVNKAGVLQGADIIVNALMTTTVLRDVIIPVGGYTLVYSFPYFSKPGVFVSPNGMVRTVKKTDESRFGITIQLLSTDGTIDLGGVTDISIAGP